MNVKNRSIIFDKTIRTNFGLFCTVEHNFRSPIHRSTRQLFSTTKIRRWREGLRSTFEKLLESTRKKAFIWHFAPGLPDFQSKNPDSGKFGGSCHGRCWCIVWPFGQFYCCLVYFVAIWYMLWPFGICCGHLVYWMVIWYMFFRFGMLHQEKSGSPALL
jgi:hypothetical protein